MLTRLLLATGLAIALSGAFAPAALAECTDWPPRANERLDVAYAFIATVTEASNTIDPAQPDTADFNWHVELRVDRLYRGHVPERLSYDGWAVGCHELRGDRLRTGDRLFVVSNVFIEHPRPPGADPFAAVGAQVVAWKRVDGRWRFYEDALDYGADRHFYPPAARQATTTEEILDLMPVGFLPDTATEAPRPTDAEQWQAPLLVVSLLAGLIAIRRRMRDSSFPR
jgi:hypothetical protein